MKNHAVLVYAFALMLLACSSTARAAGINWNGSGETGVDPYGDDWLTQNTAFQDVTSWGMPGRSTGTSIFLGGDSVSGIDLSFTLPAGVTIQTVGMQSFVPTMNVTPYSGSDLWVWTSTGPASGRFTPPTPSKTLDPGDGFFFYVPFTDEVNLNTFAFEATYEFVPEPSVAAVLSFGLLGLAASRQRTR